MQNAARREVHGTVGRVGRARARVAAPVVGRRGVVGRADLELELLLVAAVAVIQGRAAAVAAGEEAGRSARESFQFDGELERAAAEQPCAVFFLIVEREVDEDAFLVVVADEGGYGIRGSVIGDGGFDDVADLDLAVQIALHVVYVAVLVAEFKPRRRDVCRRGDHKKREKRCRGKNNKEFLHVSPPFGYAG